MSNLKTILENDLSVHPIKDDTIPKLNSLIVSNGRRKCKNNNLQYLLLYSMTLNKSIINNWHMYVTD